MRKQVFSSFFYKLYLISGSDCPRQALLLAYPKSFVVDWCKYGHNTVRLNLLTLYRINGLLVAPEGNRGEPGDCNPLALVSLDLGTTCHLHIHFLQSRRLLCGQWTFFLLLWRRLHPERKREQLSIQQTTLDWWFRLPNAVFLCSITLTPWKNF